MTKLFTTITLSFLCLSLWGQTATFQADLIPQKFVHAFLNEQFTDYELYNVPVNDINQYVKDANGNATLSLVLGHQQTWNLLLEPSLLTSSGYIVRFEDENGNMVERPGRQDLAYKGYKTNGKGGDARITLDENFIYGYVEEGKTRYFIEPISYHIPGAPINQFVVYKESNVIPNDEKTCGSTEMHRRTRNFRHQHEPAPNVDEKSIGLCYILELAIGSAFDMFQKYNTVAAVEAHNVAVMNNVQGNYDDEFADEIQFNIVEQFVATSAAADPWTTSNNAGTLLNSFTNWGPTGFNQPHDLGSLWTDRDLAGSTIGIAWVGVVCTNNRYHVLQDFSNNAALLRVLTAHEIGHNFDANHDNSGTWIMSPSVNTSQNWSPASVADVNAHIASRNCLSLCPPPIPPIPIFSANLTQVCTGSFVTFYDASLNSPDSWSWTFPGGTPSSSTEQNPTIQYNSPGVYNVTLSAGNNIGNNSSTLSGYIIVGPAGTDFFFYEGFENGLNGWTLENPDGNTTWAITPVNGTREGSVAMFMDNYNYNAPGTRDGLISPVIDLAGRSNTSLEIEYAYARYSSQFRDSLVVYVSTNGGATYPNRIFAATENGNGNFATADDTQAEFDPATEEDWCFNPTGGPGCLDLDLSQWDGQSNIRIKIENVNGYGNQMYIDNVRMLSSCLALAPPVAGFVSDITEGCVPMTVNFQDISENGPIAWNWSFPGGIPSTSNQQNPTVTYLTPGTYDVILTAINSVGTDTYILTDYITVETDPVADFDYTSTALTVNFNDLSSNNVDNYSWDFGDNTTSNAPNPTHTYDVDGAYVVTLTVSNECGTSTYIEVVTVTTPPAAAFSLNPPTGCSPVTVDFTDLSSENTVSWVWDFPGGVPSSSGDQNPTITYFTPGVYDVTLTVENLGGQTNSMTMTAAVTVNDVPSVSFTSTTVLNTVNFSNTSMGATSYLWDFGDNNTSTEVNPQHIYQDDGIYTVTLEATNDCGTVTTTSVVNILTGPAASFSAGQTSGCAPLAVQFTDQSSEGVTAWNWNFPGGTPTSSNMQNPQVLYTVPGVYDVTLIVTNPIGNDTVTLSDYITVEDVPSVGFTSSVNNLIANFTNTSINATSYSWDFGDNNSSTDPNPQHTYAMDGTYTVVLTATNDCGTVTSTETIVVSTLPQPGFSANVTAGCAPFTVSFIDESSENTTGWSWSFPGGSPSTSTSPNPIVTYNTPGLYEVSLTVSNASGSNILTQVDYIEVLDEPMADFTSTTNLGEVSFINTSTNATSYSWDFGDMNTSTDPNPVHTYQEDGTYTVTLTATGPCGTETITQQVTVILPPQAGFSATNTSGCAPLTVSFIDESSENTTAWTWDFPGGNPSTSTAQNPQVTYNTPGIYTVTLVVTNSVGQNTVTQTGFITVEEEPTAGFTSVVNIGTANFSNTSTNATSYSWDFGDMGTSTDPNPTYTYQEDGTYTVTLVATNACGSTTFTETVTIVLPPSANFSSSVTSGCAPLTVDFIDESSENTTAWLWDFPGGNPATSSAQNPTVVYDTPGSYSVTLTATNGVGQATTTQTNLIVVQELPTAGFTSVVNLGTVDFTNTATGATGYAWDFGDTNASTDPNPSHTYQEDGTYTVTLTVSNDCGQVTITDQVTVVTPPLVGFSSNVVVGCSPLTVEFTDESSENTTSWLWDFPGGDPATSTAQNPTVVYDTPGTYSVTLTAINAIGEASTTQVDYILVEETATAGFNTAINLSTVDFTNTATGATSYFWDFGDTGTSTDPNPSHTYQEDGTYIVTLTVSNDCGDVTVEQEVIIATPPLVGFSSNVVVGCSPLTVEFTDESSENTTSWLWDFPGGDPATSTSQNPTVVYDTPGTYSVTLTAINAIGEASTTQVDYILVEETATAGFNTAINLSTVDFTNTATGATSYFWDFGDTGTSTDPNPSHTYQEDGTYIVTLTVSNDCGDVTVEQEVVIATAPTAGFTSTATTGCAPFEVQFTNASSSNASGFLWDFPGGDPSTSTDPNPSVVYNTPGSYDVSLTVTNAVGESTQTETSLVVVEGVPDASFSTAVTGSTVDFTNTTINATSYFWSFGDAGTSMEPNPSYTYNEDGEYLVTLTAVNDCGSITVTELITIFVDGPSANFNLDYLGNPCAPAQVAFVDLSSDNTESIEWFFPGGNPTTSTNPNPIVVYNAAGSYDVVLIATNQNAVDTITMMDAVVIGAAPSADFDFVINASTVSFVNNSVGGVTYAWDFGDNNTSPLENPVHTYSQPGNYTVTLEVTNDCGTTTFTQILSISAVIPTASFTATPSSGCAPLVVQFEDQSEGNPDSFEWEFPGGNPSTSTDPNPVVTYETPGIYDVTLMVSNLAGTNMLVQSQIIEVIDEPTAGFTWVHTGNTVVFTNTSQGGSTYSWDFGDNNTSSNPSPMHEYLEAGVYTVTLVVENECGTSTYTETINLVTSVNGLPEGISAFELFPNPNSGAFTVSVTLEQSARQELQWSVYNVLGQRLEGGFIPSLQTGTWAQSFDWSAWAKGVYVLEVQIDNQSVFRRVVLE